ncbi:hypothetical protein ACKWTF_013503 [Chironomus riparius]
MTVGSIYIISTDLIFANLIQVSTMELDILSEKIKDVGLIDNEKIAIKELKNLIDIHQELIEVSEKLNEMFSPFQLINSFGSIVALCTGCFLAVSGIRPYFIAKFFMFPIFIPAIIFTQCYFSQLLIDSSTAISASAYNIEWYSKSVKFQKLLLVIIIKAQKPQTITALKFFDMSLEIFQWVTLQFYLNNHHN